MPADDRRRAPAAADPDPAEVDEPFTFTSTIEVCEEHAAAFESALRAVFARLQDLPACTAASLCRSSTSASTFMLFESWATRDELDEWVQSDEFRHYLAETESMYRSTRVVRSWTVLSSKPTTTDR